MREDWEIVAYRLQEWKRFHAAPLCSFCRARNVFHEAGYPDIRTTPVGDCCISCWIDWEVCEVCGVGAAVQDVVFRKQRICADCLVPDIPANAWRDWLLYFVYTPRSSFVQVLEDAFAEDFQRNPTPPRREREWPLITVLAS